MRDREKRKLRKYIRYVAKEKILEWIYENYTDRFSALDPSTPFSKIIEKIIKEIIDIIEID